MSTTVVIDTCVVRNFHVVGELRLLMELLRERGRWTDAIRFEVEHSPNMTPADFDALRASFDPAPTLDAEQVRRTQRALSRPGDPPTKHLGEAEALVSIEPNAVFGGGTFLSDDKAALDLATRRGIRTWTTGDLLAHGYHMGDVACPNAYELLVQMVNADRGVDLPVSHLGICP